MIKKVGLLIVSIALFGCAGTPTAQQIGSYPSNYRAILKAYMNETFYDPRSLRDVSISTPVVARLLLEQGWMVCVQENAKNRLGGYVGLTTTEYVINKGNVIDALPPDGDCDNVAMAPWPEMDGGGDSGGGGGPDKELKPTEGNK